MPEPVGAWIGCAWASFLRESQRGAEEPLFPVQCLTVFSGDAPLPKGHLLLRTRKRVAPAESRRADALLCRAVRRHAGHPHREAPTIAPLMHQLQLIPLGAAPFFPHGPDFVGGELHVYPTAYGIHLRCNGRATGILQRLARRAQHEFRQGQALKTSSGLQVPVQIIVYVDTDFSSHGEPSLTEG